MQKEYAILKNEKRFLGGIKMTYEICKVCGRFFEKNGKKICDACYPKEQKMYEEIKNLVLNNQGITMIEVISKTGVSIKTLKRYIAEGVLESVNRGNTFSLEETILRFKKE